MWFVYICLIDIVYIWSAYNWFTWPFITTVGLLLNNIQFSSLFFCSRTKNRKIFQFNISSLISFALFLLCVMDFVFLFCCCCIAHFHNNFIIRCFGLIVTMWLYHWPWFIVLAWKSDHSRCARFVLFSEVQTFFSLKKNFFLQHFKC